VPVVVEELREHGSPGVGGSGGGGGRRGSFAGALLLVVPGRDLRGVHGGTM
jgi:hypothetical protein